MSFEQKLLSKRHQKLQNQQQQQKIDRAYTSHEISGKDSQNELTLLMKKPFLKKRSGLFRFYKCLPTMVSTHGLHSSGNHMSRNNSKNNNNNNNMTNIEFPPKNHPRSKNSNNNNNTHGSININNGIHHGHRSTTYNANITISEMKQGTTLHSNNNNQNGGVKNKESEVEIFEIFDDPQEQNNGIEKFSTNAPVITKYNSQLETNNFEQGDTHHVISNNNSSNNNSSNNAINNYHPNNSEEILIHNESENIKTDSVIVEEQQRSHMNLDFLKDENENPCSFQPIQTVVDHERDFLEAVGNQEKVRSNVGTNHHHYDHSRERHKRDTPETKSNSKNNSNHNVASENDNVLHNISNEYCFHGIDGFTPTLNNNNNNNNNENMNGQQSSLNYPTTCISPCTIDEDDSDVHVSDPHASQSTSEIDEEHFPTSCNTSGILFHSKSSNNNNHRSIRHNHHNINNNSESIRHQFIPTNQLSEQLHHELQGIKNKVTYLEKNMHNSDQNREKMNIIKNTNYHNHLLRPLLLHSPEDQDLSHNNDNNNNSISRTKTKLRKQQQQQLLDFSNTLNNNNDFLIRSPGKNTFKNNFNFQPVFEGIQNRIDRIDMELHDIQSSFNQKMEILEEELHIKSQRWCENQIKMADKVHSLFLELESLKNTVKAQQHQVNNLAENVDKEFETVRSEWKESQAGLETRIKVLENHNNQLFDQISCNNHNNSLMSTTSSNDNNNPTDKTKIKTSNDGIERDGECPKNSTEDTDVIISSKSKQQYPVQVCNQEKKMENVKLKTFDLGSQVSPTNPPGIQFPSLINNNPSSSTLLIKNLPQDSVSREMMGSQIISARKTLLNGDIETVYTNGTREIIKADKSEIRHMYRNGDVRTVSNGTVTYFYAESSTWQTTYPSGVELFKFPNGVIEKRLPNGIIEQTDIEGRVTFFQQAHTLPAKVNSNGIDMSVTPTLKHGDDNSNTEINNTAISSHKALGMGLCNTAETGNGLKLSPGERMIVFENGENEIHGADYRRRVFPDGTIKTVYNDGSQETRYVNGRVRIKDATGVLVADVNLNDKNGSSTKPTKLVRDFGA